MSTEQLLMVMMVALALILGLFVGYLLGSRGRSRQGAEAPAPVFQTLSEIREGLTFLRDEAVVNKERRPQDDEAHRRLQGIAALLGTSKAGNIGERVVADALAVLPLGWVIRDYTVGGKTVEFAINLPSGDILPIDSKVVDANKLAELDQTQEPDKRSKLERDIRENALERVGEAVKYNDQRSPGYAIAAVPDSAYNVCGPIRYEAFRDYRTLIVPDSLLVQFILMLSKLYQQQAAVEPDIEQMLRVVDDVERYLAASEETLNGHIGRAMTTLRNGYDALNGQLADTRRAFARIRAAKQAQTSAKE